MGNDKWLFSSVFASFLSLFGRMVGISNVYTVSPNGGISFPDFGDFRVRYADPDCGEIGRAHV
jgi:hypothetical protein